MKLNLDILRDYLAESVTVKTYNLESQKLLFNRPVIFEPEMELEADNLYVLRSQDLPQIIPRQNIGIVCIGERIPAAWITSDIQILSVSGTSKLITVFNRIQQIYDYFDRWDGLLRDELEKDDDFNICNLLLLGSEVLGNPINVVEQTLQALWDTEFYYDSKNKLKWRINDSPMRMSELHTEAVKKVCNLERSLTIPYLSAIEIPGMQSYCNNIYYLGYFVGCISITSARHAFQERDFPLADHFFLYFQKAFFKYLRNHNQVQSPGAAALQKLLRHESMTDSEKQFFQLKSNEKWILFKLKENRHKKFLPKDYMYGTINALMPQNIYVALYHKEIVGVIRITGRNDPILKSFESLIQRMDYFAGLSNFFTDTVYVDDYLIQAHYAAEQSCFSENNESLYSFKDCSLKYMLHACTLEMSSAALVSENLLAMLEYDRQKGTEYIKTLDIYLKSEMNVSRTAEILYIHRSSLMKRLEKIYRFLENDLTDPNARLYYRLCLALLS